MRIGMIHCIVAMEYYAKHHFSPCCLLFQVKCMDSSSKARFCVYENALMDFSKMHDVSRSGRSTGSRKWDLGFLATHCAKEHSDINYFGVSD